MAMTIAEGVAAIDAIVPVIMGFVTDVLALFMEPPLIFFVGAAFVVVAFKIAAYVVRMAKGVAS